MSSNINDINIFIGRFQEISNNEEQIVEFIETLNESDLSTEQLIHLANVIKSTHSIAIENARLAKRLHKVQTDTKMKPASLIAITLLGLSNDGVSDASMFNKKLKLIYSFMHKSQHEVVKQLLEENFFDQAEMMELMTYLSERISDIKELSHIIEALKYYPWTEQEIQAISESNAAIMLLFIKHPLIPKTVGHAYFEREEEKISELLASGQKGMLHNLFRFLSYNTSPILRKILWSSAIENQEFDMAKILIQKEDNLNPILEQIVSNAPGPWDDRGSFNDLIMHLIDLGGDINIKMQSGKTLLQNAFEYGNEGLITRLIEKGADMAEVMQNLFSLLRCVDDEFRDKLLNSFIHKGIPPDTVIEEQSLIDFVLDNGCIDCLRTIWKIAPQLLEHKAIPHRSYAQEFQKVASELGIPIVSDQIVGTKNESREHQAEESEESSVTSNGLVERKTAYFNDPDIPEKDKWQLIVDSVSRGKDVDWVVDCLRSYIERASRRFPGDVGELFKSASANMKRQLAPLLKDFLKSPPIFYVQNFTEFEILLNEVEDKEIIGSENFVQIILNCSEFKILQYLYEKYPDVVEKAVHNKLKIEGLEERWYLRHYNVRNNTWCLLHFMIKNQIIPKNEELEDVLFNAAVTLSMDDYINRSQNANIISKYKNSLNKKLLADLENSSLSENFFDLALRFGDISFIEPKQELKIHSLLLITLDSDKKKDFLKLLKKARPNDPYLAYSRYRKKTNFATEITQGILKCFEKNEDKQMVQYSGLKALYATVGEKDHLVVPVAFLTKDGLYGKLSQEARSTVVSLFKSRWMRNEIVQEKLLRFLIAMDEEKSETEKIVLLNLAFSQNTREEAIDQMMYIVALKKAGVIIGSEDPKALLEEEGLKILGLNTNPVLAESYRKITANWNKPMVLSLLAFGYAQIIFENERTGALNDLRAFVLELIEKSFHQNRYLPENNVHLNLVEKFSPGILAKWKESSEKDLVTVLATQQMNSPTLSSQTISGWTQAHRGQLLVLCSQLDMPILKKLLQHPGSSEELVTAAKDLQEECVALSKQVRNAKEQEYKTKVLLLKQKQLERSLLMFLSDPHPVNEESLNKFKELQQRINQAFAALDEENQVVYSEFADDLRQLVRAFSTSVKEEQNYAGWKLVNTDNPELLIMAGEYVLSCQRITGGDPNYNRALMGYVRNGETRMVAIVDDKNKIVARVIIRIGIEDSGKDTLLSEYPYPVVNMPIPLKRALLQEIREIEQRLGIEGSKPLTLSQDVMELLDVKDENVPVVEERVKKNTVIFFAGGPSETTYFDTGKGVTQGIAKIKAYKQIV